MKGRLKSIGRVAMALVLAVSLGLVMAAPVSAATITVDADGGADYTTIQAAIDAASAGDTITVAEGTYSENLVVDKALTIQSSGATAATTINAFNGNVYVVEITADGVTLDGFTITGMANGGENMAAVITQGVDSCTITNNILTGNYKDAINLFSVGTAYSDYNTVSNNVINGPNGVGDTFGIKIKGSHNTIIGNEVYNTDTPILVWSWSDTETASPDYNTISGNTIGPGADTAAYKWGITLKTGNFNVVTGNTITDAERAAIYLYTSDAMAAEEDFDPRPANDTISDNIITGGEVGIALMEGANTNTISGNTISGTAKAGILGSLSRWPGDFGDSPSSYLVGAPESYLQITGNTISGNTIDSCGHGIAMEYADDNTLTGNTIQDNTSVVAIDFYGVGFTADAAGVYFDANSSGNVAHYNNITGNTGYGLKSEAALDATNNWWGDASGPYLVNGLGDKVSPYVDARVWLDAPYPEGETTGLRVGESYNLYIDLGADNGGATILLDDIGNDALAPDDPVTEPYNVPDAFQYTLSTQGTKIISGVSPQYGTYTGGDGEDGQYIGIAGEGGIEDELWWLEVLPADVVTITSDASFTYHTGATFTATVEKSGEPLLATVEVHLDDTGEGVLPEEGFITEGATDPETGQVEFSLTDEQMRAAGSLVLYVEGGDVGGLEGTPTLTDGVDDVASATLALDIGPLDLDVTTQPSQLFASFPTDVTVTATDEEGLPFDGAAVVLDGAGLVEDLGVTDEGGVASGTITAPETGEIEVTVSRSDAETGAPPEYLGMATIAVGLAEILNVTVPEEWVIADYDMQGGVLEVTIQGSDAKGPDGNPEGLDNELDYVDIVVTSPDVTYSLSKAYWAGAAWALFDESALPTGVSGVDSDTITFEIAPNMANEDVTVEVTGYTYADPAFTAVGTEIETVTVLGYALYNYPTDDVSVDQPAASLSLDVETRDGQVVNFATVTITAGVNAFGKDFDDSGEIEEGEEFAGITIVNNLITYGETGETEPYYVNNGHYEVTDITFVAVADVSIHVSDGELTAFLDPAFSIIGVDVYDISLDVTTATAGVDTEVVVTVTEDGEPVTEIDNIKLDGDEVLDASTSEDGEYTITVPATPELDALTVKVIGEAGTKYSTTTLEVALPTLSAAPVLLLAGVEDTVSVTVTDALGEPLAEGSVWLGTYDGTAFLSLADSALDVDGAADLTLTPAAGTLVWKVGGPGVAIGGAALLPEPEITVEVASLNLAWDPEAPVVGEAITFYVTDNYGEPMGDIPVQIVTPGGDPVEKVTTPTGVFMYTPTDPGDYYVSVDDEDPVTVTVVVTPLASIASLPESVDLYVEETEQLAVTATYGDASTDDVTADATYASDDDTVATVSEAGLVTAVAEGTATITVSYTEGVITETADILVTVSEVPVLASIAASPSEASLNVDETEQLAVTASYSDLTDAVVTADATYASDDETVATVSEAGLVTAVAEGTATITVSYTEDEVTMTDDVSVTVTVVEPLTIQLYEGANPILYTGATIDLPGALTDIEDITEIIWQRDVSTGGAWYSYLVSWGIGEITQLENNTVYIIVVSEDCIWELSQ